MKTSELTGAALDWAVAKCENKGLCITRPDLLAEGLVAPLRYSSNWGYGGPIIEREDISTDYAQTADWAARSKTYQWAYGPTPLIAAMRCYVASKMGEDIDVPKELT